MDSILVWENNELCLHTTASCFRQTKYEAFVYVLKDKTPKQLSDMCDVLNKKYKDSEWLWSHPLEGGDSTHVPCLIQQDRQKLTTLRKAIGYDG